MRSTVGQEAVANNVTYKFGFTRPRAANNDIGECCISIPRSAQRLIQLAINETVYVISSVSISCWFGSIEFRIPFCQLAEIAARRPLSGIT